MKLKKITTFLFGAALIGIMAAGSTTAYFTDGDTATNTFTVGKISLDLQEPDWEPEDGEDLTPGETIEKNPKIENDGTNEAFVFAEVIVPYRNIITANKDGSKNRAADTELFTYTVNRGWTELGQPVQNIVKETVTHLYVYGTKEECSELAKGEITPAIFDRVKFADVVEGQGLENTVQEIKINVYGIQTTDVDGGKKAPAEIWPILSSQAPDVEVSEPEDAKTDKKQ